MTLKTGCYERLASDARMKIAELRFGPILEDPDYDAEKPRREYGEILMRLEEGAKAHISAFIPFPAIGAKNICLVHLYRIHDNRRYRVLGEARAMSEYRLVMVEDAVDYFSGISRGVEKGKFKSVLLAHDDHGELLEDSYYGLFRNSEENLVGGCYKKSCVADFSRSLRREAPRTVSVVGRWTFDLSKLEEKIIVHGEL
ncbi:MAG: hypothetical protein V1731_03305 [Candidatus Aenigmatarchaeota archaeon]